jgi:hypothetical protein
MKNISKLIEYKIVNLNWGSKYRFPYNIVETKQFGNLSFYNLACKEKKEINLALCDRVRNVIRNNMMNKINHHGKP